MAKTPQKLRPQQVAAATTAEDRPEPSAASLGLAAACGGISLLAALFCLHWPTLADPFDLQADNTLALVIAKSIREFGWYGHNARLGAPGTINFLDFPLSDHGHFLFLKLLGMFCGDAVTTLNAYFLLTFALCAATACWVLQRCAMPPLLAACGGLLFSLLPYHFLRGCAHIWLGGYFCVPLCIYIVLSASQVLVPAQRLSLRSALCCAAVVPAFGVYYTFYFAYLLLVASLLQAATAPQGRRVLRDGALLLGTTVAGQVVSLLPSLWRRLQNLDPVELLRSSTDAEIYSLKLAQLLVPAEGHRNALLAQLADLYNKRAPLVSENKFVSMGLVLSLCFVVVVARSCACTWAADATPHSLRSRLRKVFLLNLLCLIYGTVGGLSSLFALYVSLFLRSSNRIAVYIYFLVVLAAAWLLDDLWRRRIAAPHRRPLAGLLALCCIGLCLWEHRDTDYFPLHDASTQLYHADAQFFAQLEAQLPPDGQIYQLPYVPFPEGGLGVQDYFQARPYLHTARGRFSFGASRGSRVAQQNAALAGLLGQPDGRFLQALRAHKFTGVLLSRGIPTRDRQPLLPKLTEVLGPPRLQSANQEWFYFAL